MAHSVVEERRSICAGYCTDVYTGLADPRALVLTSRCPFSVNPPRSASLVNQTSSCTDHHRVIKQTVLLFLSGQPLAKLVIQQMIKCR